jgi:hypothetical protein
MTKIPPQEMATPADGLFSASATLGRPQVRSVQHRFFVQKTSFELARSQKIKEN